MKHVKIILSTIGVVLFLLSCAPMKTNAQNLYYGQKGPGMVPEIFAPNLISLPDRYEFGSVFSKNGKELFFGVETGQKAIIYHSELVDGVWSAPKILLENEAFGNNDPFLSPDEKRLYFISNKPLDGSDKGKDIDIWYVERTDTGWSSPINAGPQINSAKNEYYISFTETGTMYFSSNVQAEEGNNGNFDIYSSQSIDGEFQAPVKLSVSINTPSYEADVFVSPDESFVIFCANRREGLGRGDLYISFKDEQGNWTPSKNMGEPINSKGHELCPFVSRDGKYFFYTSNQDIYWVSTEILEGYR